MFRQLLDDVNFLKEQQRNAQYHFKQFANTEYKTKERMEIQPEALLGMHLGIVVDTQDPLKQGGVRFYTPFLTEEEIQKDGLPWAYPISPFGGFDDSGCTWVPPAGSRIAILFLHGDRQTAFYFGSIWHRTRGVGSSGHLKNWNYSIPEYDCLWEGNRKGYLVGSNEGDQVFHPWNTEMYNGYDEDSFTNFYNDPKQYNATTYPYIKGFKTEMKHMLKFVEGDPRCNRRFNRVEFASGRGNWIMFKDDHLHPAGQWAFGDMSGDLTFCHREKSSSTDDDSVLDIPKEFPCCSDDSGEPQRCFPPGCMPKTCPESSTTHSSVDRTSKFANPFYKRYEEMRPYWGANTPQRNKCELDQSGVQIQSISGHQIILDDSVNQPKGVPTWDQDYDFGCDDTCRGKIEIKSSTGHQFQINDYEDIGQAKIRGEDNGFSWRTASGNFFEINDHTVGSNCQGEYAGPRSGFTMMSRSTHLFQMNDHHVKQSSPVRKEGGIPKKADEPGFEGYVLLRSGYGLTMLMKDSDRQDQTEDQFMLLMAPQTTNTKRGPHMLSMQEQKSGPGYVILRAGGALYQSSYDESIEVVGVEGENPASKFTTVTDKYLIDVKDMYFNHNDLTVQWAEKYIFLLAGKDCPPSDDPESDASASSSAQSSAIDAASANPGSNDGASDDGSPCIYNVIVSKDPWVCPFTSYVHYGVKAGEDGIELDSRSKRVFASADKTGE